VSVENVGVCRLLSGEKVYHLNLVGREEVERGAAGFEGL
jgi:hypothetical protein